VTGKPSAIRQRTESEWAKLEPGPASAAAARRMVRAFAARNGVPDNVTDTICLAASELVTNSVLHARTRLVLTLKLRPGAVRIGVRDGFPGTPTVRHYPPEALTGRGLAVVAALSRAWGVDSDHDGKLVWAEIGLDGAAGEGPDAAPRTTGQQPGAAPEGAGGHARTLRFPGVPVDVYLAMQEHNDALFRELELLAIEHDAGPEGAPAEPRLRELARELLGSELRELRDAHREAVAEAQAKGQTTVDLRARASAEVVPMTRAFVELLDEADAYCQAGVLLTTPPDPPVTALRHWFVEQFAAQLIEGRRPSPPAL
jgi:anti-sigma regulatory factor (Ser/Thr protein kinase)